MIQDNKKTIKCIICMEIKESSDEHVIPDALGGVYHIYNVCKDCNSFLGQFVDCRLTNHKLSEFERFLRGIKGKSGSIPNPFGKFGRLKSGESVKIEIDDQGKPQAYLMLKIGSVEGDLSSDGRATINVVGDARDETMLRDAVKKKLTRAGLPVHNIQENLTKGTVIPEIEANWAVDLLNFKQALIKIAYEFTCDQLNSYIETEDAANFRSFLKKQNVDEEFVNAVSIGNGFNHEQSKVIEDVVEVEPYCHYALLCRVEHGLICAIRIFDKFSIAINMSKSFQFDGVRLLINDTIDHKCKILNEIDIASGVQYGDIHFGYYFSNLNEMNEFKNLESNPEFSWEVGSNGNVVFYDEQCESIIGDWDSLYANGVLITDYNEPSNVRYIATRKIFVKTLPSGKYFQVVEFMQPIINRKINSKL